MIDTPTAEIAGPPPRDIAILAKAPSNGAVWRIVLTAITATIVVIAVLGGGYLLYDAKADEISQLKQQRHQLLSAKETLSTELATVQTKLEKRNLQLTKTTKKLNATRRDLKKTSAALVAANNRADANYSAGYNVGNSSGYSSGHNDGLVAGSDQLVCSDDPDVTWLPACYYD